MDAAKISVVLSHLAEQFENAEQRVAELPSAQGWGQFLDDPKAHHQTGPYGTSAGVIVSALAGRGAAALEPRIGTLLQSWWDDWKAGRPPGHRLFCQTPRLAFFYLGLRLSRVLESSGIGAEVESELLRRVLPSGMWGNYWTSPTILDQTPRLFCSAIVVLVAALIGDVPAPTLPRLEPAVRQLEEALVGDNEMPLLHAAAACAAILAVRKGKASSRVRKRMRQIAWSRRASLADLGVYFYDFQWAREDASIDFGRDYFIVPSEVLMGIAGLQPDAPAPLRARAEATAKALLANMSAHQGVYRSDSEQRVSAKNQAWSAMLLHLSKRDPTIRGWCGKVWYELRRERKGNWFTEVGFPLFSLCAIATVNVAVKDLGTPVNIAATIGMTIIVGLYGSTFLRKWFPGR
jgi:hypothetical protein